MKIKLVPMKHKMGDEIIKCNSTLPKSIRSSRSQPCDRSTDHTPIHSTASPFNFQYPVFSLRSSGSCLCFLPRPLYRSFNNVFQKAVPTHYVANTDSLASFHCTWCVQVLRSPKEAFAAAMQSWRERCEKCVCLQGDYVEK